MQEKRTRHKAYKVPDGYFNQLEQQLNTIPCIHTSHQPKYVTKNSGLLVFAIAASVLTLFVLSYQFASNNPEQDAKDLFALEFIETEDLIEYAIMHSEELNEAPQSDELIISYLLDENVEVVTISDEFLK